ncbi:MAG TPA: metallophosphoesterase [Lysobacter sp.]
MRQYWRRQPSWLRRIQLGVLLIAFACAAWGFGLEPRRLVQRDYALALPHWSPQCDGLRVDVISDTHTGSPHNGVDNLDRVVRSLIASDSEAVLLAGDYLSLSVFLGTYVRPEVIASHLKPLTARKPVYAVLGNHDWWKNGDTVRAALESAGVVVLENQAREVALGDCRLWLVGVGDLWEGKPDVARAFAAVDNDLPALALTHNPDLFPRMPARASLLVAGHTHGGQVVLPLIGRPVVPASERYAIGHVVEGGRHLFVTPGIGTSILPVRFGVPPEISRLTLRAE